MLNWCQSCTSTLFVRRRLIATGVGGRGRKFVQCRPLPQSSPPLLFLWHYSDHRLLLLRAVVLLRSFLGYFTRIAFVHRRQRHYGHFCIFVRSGCTGRSRHVFPFDNGWFVGRLGARRVPTRLEICLFSGCYGDERGTFGNR